MHVVHVIVYVQLVIQKQETVHHVIQVISQTYCIYRIAAVFFRSLESCGFMILQHRFIKRLAVFICFCQFCQRYHLDSTSIKSSLPAFLRAALTILRFSFL